MELDENELTPQTEHATISLKDLLEVGMGSYREFRPERWRVTFYFEGDRFDIYRNKDKEPLETERQCAKTLAYIEQLIERKEFDPAAWRKDKPFLFKDAVQTWIKLTPVSRETLGSREGITDNYLIPFFGDHDIRDIRKLHIDKFVAHLKSLKRKDKKLADKTIYNILAELRACLRFHADSLPKVPTFPKIQYQDKPINWLTWTQQEEVFEFIPNEDKPIFTFQRFMGVRPGEARGLLKKNVHRDKGIIIISSVIDSHGSLIERTKTKRIRVLPIVPEIEEILKPTSLGQFVFTRPNGMPYTKRVHEEIWKKANREAHEKYGTPLVSMYPGTKHSFGMQRLNSGFTMDEVKAVLGHKDKSSTERYAKYLTESLSNVIRGKVAPYGANVVQKAVSD